MNKSGTSIENYNIFNLRIFRDYYFNRESELLEEATIYGYLKPVDVGQSIKHLDNSSEFRIFEIIIITIDYQNILVEKRK